jgi:hypothetical protein
MLTNMDQVQGHTYSIGFAFSLTVNRREQAQSALRTIERAAKRETANVEIYAGR